MTTLLTNNAEGGTSGTTVTTANSGGTSGNAFNLVSIPTGNTATFTSSHYEGSLAYDLGFDSVSGQGVILRWGDSLSLANTGQRLMAYLNANPSSSSAILTYHTTSGTRIASLVVTSAGLLQAQDATGVAKWTSTSSLPLNTWIRLEMYVGIGTTTSNGTLGAGYGSGSAALTESFNSSALNLGTTNVIRTQVGKVTGQWPSASHLLVDAWTVTDTAGFVGAVSTAVTNLDVGSTTPSNIYVGTTAVTALYAGSVKVWG